MPGGSGKPGIAGCARIRSAVRMFTTLGPTDWAAVTRLYDAGGADFSMHAFRDDFYMTRPDYKPYAVLADKPVNLAFTEFKIDAIQRLNRPE